MWYKKSTTFTRKRVISLLHLFWANVLNIRGYIITSVILYEVKLKHTFHTLLSEWKKVLYFTRSHQTCSGTCSVRRDFPSPGCRKSLSVIEAISGRLRHCRIRQTEIANIKEFFIIILFNTCLSEETKFVVVLWMMNSFSCVQRCSACVSSIIVQCLTPQLIHQYIIIPRRFTISTPKIIINIISYRFIHQCNTTPAD